MANVFIQASYFAVAVVFILGLKAMSSPVTARKGIVWAGYAMVAATVVTFFTPNLGNVGLMVLAIVSGGAVAWWSGKTVKMTDMPQMVAIYNGMGGGAAAAIAALEFARGEVHGPVVATLAVLGALIGSVAFSGSCIAYAKLQGIMKNAFRLPQQNMVNIGLAAVTALLESRRPDGERSAREIERQHDKIERGLVELEARVGSRRGFDGATLQIGDVAAGCALGYLDLRFPTLDWRGRHPALATYAARLLARPSFVDTTPPAG